MRELEPSFEAASRHLRMRGMGGMAVSHAMLRSTPPSTRKAAPVVALAAGVQR